MHISICAYIKIFLFVTEESRRAQICVCVGEKTSEAGHVINEGLDVQNSIIKKNEENELLHLKERDENLSGEPLKRLWKVDRHRCS